MRVLNQALATEIVCVLRTQQLRAGSHVLEPAHKLQREGFVAPSGYKHLTSSRVPSALPTGSRHPSGCHCKLPFHADLRPGHCAMCWVVAPFELHIADLIYGSRSATAHASLEAGLCLRTTPGRLLVVLTPTRRNADHLLLEPSAPMDHYPGCLSRMMVVSITSTNQPFPGGRHQ